MGVLIMQKECEDCWHNYHCPMPQEGYDYDPDNDKKIWKIEKNIVSL